MSRTIHPLSVLSFRETIDALSEREGEVCLALLGAGEPLTDREIRERLGAQDMNYVRPCITRLVQDGVLIERDSVRCVTTGHLVRRTWFAGVGDRLMKEEGV